MSALNYFGPSTGLADAILGQRAPMLFDPALNLKTAELQLILALWNEKRGARRMPPRAGFSMRDLSFALPQLCFVDVVQDGGRTRYKIRLMGTSMDHHLAPITGKFVDEAVPPQFVERWETMYTRALDARAPIRVSSRVAFRDQFYLIGEGLVLPLANDGETPSGLLVVIFHYGSDTQDEKRLRLFAALTQELDQAFGDDAVTSQS